MANKCYVSVSGKAKPTRKMYVSVGGKAKLVKRAYMSVGGKAKIFYDTVVVSYVNDNGYTNNTTVSSTERIGRGCKATKKDNKTWYKSDGPVFDFNTAVTSNLTLYEAVYTGIDNVTFDGSHYCPTDVKIPKSEMDLRMYPCYASDITVQRRVFSMRGTPTVEMYINGSGYWNYGIGNTYSGVSWSVRPNNVKAKVNERMWWRLNISGDNHYNQTWTDSASGGNWASVTALSQSTSSSTVTIGGVYDKSDKPFKGTLPALTGTNIAFDCYQRKKGGSTVQGYAYNQTHKFYPLQSW